MAGLKAGVYKDIERLKSLNNDKNIIEPSQSDTAEKGYAGWLKAVASTA